MLIRLDWIKDDCWDLAEVCAPLSAILINVISETFAFPTIASQSGRFAA